MDSINIQDIISIAREAGKEILKVYSKRFDVEYKEENGRISPLTEADRLSNDLIVERLSFLFPEIPIISEEGKAVKYEERKKWKFLWLIDPLDGTKEFVKRNGEFTVNIALIKDHKPILGVVYAPDRNVLYYGDKNGSFKEENGKLVRLGSKEKIRQNQSKHKLVVVASKSHFNPETKQFIESLNKEYELVSIGSSLKLCIVAEGKADIYPRLAPTMEWDTAAAHAIVNFSGGRVYNFKTSQELSYNKEDLLNDWFVVE